jgi:hypothetical protein
MRGSVRPTARRIALRLGFGLALLLAVASIAELWARSRWELADTQLGDGPALYTDHPTWFWTFTPDHALRVGPTLYESNARGFRGPDVEMPKPPGRFRVLTVGESSTMGMGVDEADIYPRMLETRLRARGLDADVFNAGVGAWTVWQSSIYLEEEGWRLQPDVVVAYHQHNDFLPRGVVDPHNFLYAVPYGDKELYQRRKWAAPLLGLLYRSRAYLVLRKEVLTREAQLPMIHSRSDFPARVPEADRREAWARIAGVCVEHGAKLVIVRPKYDASFDHDRLLDEVSAQYQAPLVDIVALAARPEAPRPFLLDGIHPSPAGHAAIAEALAEVVGAMAGR